MKDFSSLLNRLKKNLKSRKPKLSQYNISAFRLYEKDIPEYPYIIDIYNQSAVVYEKGKNIQNDDELLKKKTETHEIIQEALNELLGINKTNITFKERNVQRGLKQYEKLGRNPNTLVVEEGPAKFYVNLKNYLDTGLFLDHRPLRNKIYKSSKGKTVLNLFSYTGSISTVAALGGGKVTTIDMSKTYLSWAEENFTLNNLKPQAHKFLQKDILSYLKGNINETYDLIILDPPSFSNSKRMEEDFNIQDDHIWMIKNLMRILKDGGTLFFSNNFRKFRLAEELTDIYSIKDITRASIPFDFKDPKIHSCYEIRHK